MTPQELVDIENALLRTELGTHPLWAWKHSSTLRIGIHKIKESATAANGIEPQYEYRANPDTGLIELSPIYVYMPMLPMLPNSWVLCRYVEADQKAAFQQHFGTRIEYPVGGIWQPLKQTALKPGVIPNRRDTWNMIQGARANEHAVRDFFVNAEERQDKQEKADAARFADICRDRFTANMELPGKKGGSSFFSGRPDEPVVLKKELQ